MDRKLGHIAHQTNRAKLVRAANRLERALNAAIKDEDDALVYVNTRLSIILWTSWAESTLVWLACHPRISDAESEKVIEANKKGRVRALAQRWETLVSIAFDLAETNPWFVDPSRAAQRKMVVQWVKQDLAPFVELRNKLAHGQWAMCLSRKVDKSDAGATSRVLSLTKGDVLLLKTFVEVVARLVETLIAQPREFDDVLRKSEERVKYAMKKYTGDVSWLVAELRSRRRPTAPSP